MKALLLLMLACGGPPTVKRDDAGRPIFKPCGYLKIPLDADCCRPETWCSAPMKCLYSQPTGWVCL